MDYPHKDGRGTVTGQLVLDDPQAAKKTLPNLNVGLTHPNYKGVGTGFQPRAATATSSPGRTTATTTSSGPTARRTADSPSPTSAPATYTLHAFADGVLGEYAKTDITVEAGKKIDLGKLDWQPVRYGKQIWEIGYPDRTGDKFFKGDGANYWLWGWGLRYAGLFPNDITYTIGKSDYHKDWFFEEVPHSTTTAWLNPAAKDPYNQRFGWVSDPSQHSEDPWRAVGPGPRHHLDRQVQHAEGRARARLSCASRWPERRRHGNAPSVAGSLTIGVNGQDGRHHPSRRHQRSALQHRQGRVVPVHPEVRRLAAEAGRE